jgi:hypothetical protein
MPQTLQSVPARDKPLVYVLNSLVSHLQVPGYCSDAIVDSERRLRVINLVPVAHFQNCQLLISFEGSVEARVPWQFEISVSPNDRFGLFAKLINPAVNIVYAFKDGLVRVARLRDTT